MSGDDAMRARILLGLMTGLLALLLTTERARAEASCFRDGRRLTIGELLQETLDRQGAGGLATLPLTAARPTAAAASMAVITVGKGGAGIPPAAWRQAELIGGARSREEVVVKHASGPNYFVFKIFNPVLRRDHARAGRRVEVTERQDEQAVVRMEVPENRSGLYGETWLFVIAACEAGTGRMLGFGVTEVRVNPFGWSVAIAATVVILLWLLVARWAWAEHAKRLQECWKRNAPEQVPGQADPADPLRRPARWRDLSDPEVQRRLVWKARRALDPVFISQDALGSGSMSRLQILAFTLTVGGVALYVFLRSGALSEMSAGVLQLLGVTAAGSTLAQLASATPGLTPRSRQILFGTGSLRLGEDLPGWRDVVTANGEVDVTRVQALVFSGLAIVSLVVNGAANLAEFALPQSVVALLGLSQGIYVFGKLVPSETMRQLEQQLKLVREAAGNLRATATADRSAAEAAFAQAKAAAAATADDLFGDRFDGDRFRALSAVAVPP